MSSVETGQMSAVETGQMSAVETRQMSSVARADICLVATHNVEVSEVSSGPMSQCSSLRRLNYGNITMFKSQIGGLALNRRKWVQNGRQVLRIGAPASPGHLLPSGTDPAAQNRQNITQTPDQPPPGGRCL